MKIGLVDLAVGLVDLAVRLLVRIAALEAELLLERAGDLDLLFF